ncbi:MAG: FecR domain-containing protein [Bacteroidota bacterium]
MKNQKELIQKYLEGSASAEEIKLLEEWLGKDSKNKHFFKKVVSDWNISSKYNSEEFDSEEAFKSFIAAIRKSSANDSNKKISLRRINPIIKYAAVVAVIVSFSFYLYLSQNIDNTDNIIVNGVVLELDDGTIKVLDENYVGPIYDKNGEAKYHQQHKVLSYTSIKDNSNHAIEKKTGSNEIRVPYGEIFKLILSDGSSVMLNAGSKLTFPQEFTGDLETRTVELEGEAFFSVTKNADRPFIVQTADMNVKVLGTSFNVSAYPEDEYVKTVLVEGAVNVFDSRNLYEDKTISPNQIAVFERRKNRFRISDVNTADYTAWTTNKLLFNNEPFIDIAKKIERRYNVKIINHYDSLNNIPFYGEFDNESIDDVLKTFSSCIDFSYSINDNIITINKTDDNN